MLLQRIASGDASAVTQCLEQYGNLVWSIARRWSPSHCDAEDAVQEIFMDLWKSAGRFDPQIASESTFVTMVARRRLIDRQRRSRRRSDAEDEVYIDNAVAEEDEPLQQLEKGEEVQIAEELIRDLRPEEREVLNMSVRDGLTHQEIADRTGVPLGTVKTHIRRGLRKVRERFQSGSVHAVSRSMP